MRVTKILDPSRPRPSQLWKPAVPAVVVVAGLCVFSASQAPVLIGFADRAPAATAVAVRSMSNRQAMQIDVAAKSTAPNQRIAQVVVAAKSMLPSAITKPKMVAAKFRDSAAASEPKVRAWDAALMSSEVQHRAALKKYAAQGQIKEARQPKSAEGNRAQATLLAETLFPKASAVQPEPAPEYVTVREEFFMVVKQGTPSSTPASWQVHIVEISVVLAQPQQKQVPRKI
jgi:hypothetical protein